MKIEIKDELFNEEELINTPRRVKDYIEYNENHSDFIFTTFPSNGYDQMIILKNINFNSLCSHHLMPFYGHVSIGYIPQKKLCGISKLARIIDMHSRYPQMQETFTKEIMDSIKLNLNPKGIMVVIEGKHTCMMCRGPKKIDAVMITSAIDGVFKKDNETR